MTLSSNIDKAFEQKDSSLIEEQTYYLLLDTFHNIMQKFSDEIVAIKATDLGINEFSKKYIVSDRHHKKMLYWERLNKLTFDCDGSDLGCIKIDLDEWYYELGLKYLTFIYQDDYLMNVKDTCERLNISRPTLYKYIEAGLEIVDTNSQKKIPKFVLNIWNNRTYFYKMQQNFQLKKLRDQSYEDQYKELMSEITEYELKYKGSYNEVFKNGIKSHEDAEEDQIKWLDLLEEKEEILNLIKGSPAGG